MSCPLSKEFQKIAKHTANYEDAFVSLIVIKKIYLTIFVRYISGFIIRRG